MPTQGKPVGIYGSMRDEIPGGGHTAKTMPEAHEAMGINWMIWGELVEAIPPAYTHYIGQQIMRQLDAPSKCNTINCTNLPIWYSIVDEKLFCDNCAKPIGSYVRPINA